MQLLLNTLSCTLFMGAVFGTTSKVSNLPRIKGGERALDGEVPWIVTINHISTSNYINGESLCSGVIISERHILTLASCCYGSPNCQEPSSLAVRTGSLVSSGFGGTFHQVISITDHENFNITSRSNDISIWEVFPPFEFNKRSYPIALPIQNADLEENFKLTIAGFGNDPTQPGSNWRYGVPLQRAQVNNIPLLLCESIYSNTETNYVTADTLCAGWTNKNCLRDFGGPLYHNGVLYGLIKSQLNGYECNVPSADSKPGLYTKVSLFVDWIREKTDLYPATRS